MLMRFFIQWHALTKDEQGKYYELARQERHIHMQRHPTWNARDNYGMMKKKKRKRDKTTDGGIQWGRGIARNFRGKGEIFRGLPSMIRVKILASGEWGTDAIGFPVVARSNPGGAV